MWCLEGYLPLIIGDLVLNKDLHWDNYIVLLDIVDEPLSLLIELIMWLCCRRIFGVFQRAVSI